MKSNVGRAEAADFTQRTHAEVRLPRAGAWGDGLYTLPSLRCFYLVVHDIIALEKNAYKAT